MNQKNSVFKSIDLWKDKACCDLRDVIDKTRCLENITAPKISMWHVADGGANASKPTAGEMEAFEEFNLSSGTKKPPVKDGWIAAKMQLPLIAQYIESPMGKWEFEFIGPYDPDVYCDDTLLEKSVFMRKKFTLCEFDEENFPWVFLRIPSPQRYPIHNLMGKCSLTGLEKYTDIAYDVAHSLRAAAEIIDTENVRSTNYISENLSINKSKISDEERREMAEEIIAAANSIDFSLVENPDTFIENVKASLEKLPKTRAYVKKFTLFFIGHSHMDLAWKWRWAESIECMKGTLENQLSLMERNPEYVYVESSPVVWDALNEKYPEMWERCRQAALRGQLEPQGGMWCEPDVMCIGQESMMEHLRIGQEKSIELMGKPATCGFNIDAFGFSYALPKILNKAGIYNFVTQKLRYNEFSAFPYNLFWWESDDGSRVLSLHVCSGHTNTVINPDEIAQIVRHNHLVDGAYTIPVMWGYGNHGGGPQHEMMDRVEALKKLSIFPNVKYCGFTKYFELIREELDLDELPVVKNELFLETHHKTYTAQAKMKLVNRELERDILNTEALASVAGTYSREKFDAAWRVELFNQFHDVLSGTSIPSVYKDVFDDVDRAYSTLDTLSCKAAQKLFGEGDRRYIYNPIPWRRNAIIELPSKGFGKEGSVCDLQGNIYPYQQTEKGDKIVFNAQLPAFGFEEFTPCDKPVVSSLRSTENSVSNKYISVEFDEKNGIIKSISGNGAEFKNASIGKLKLLEDKKAVDYATWNMGLTGKEFDVKCVSFEKIEDGPARVVFKAKYTFGDEMDKRRYYGSLILWHTPGTDYPTSFFEQYFTVYENSKTVDCTLKAEWWENNKILKVAAQTDMIDTKAKYNIQFGTIERPTKRETVYEKARYEVPAIYYGDLNEEKRGIAIYNRGKHGYDALGGNLRLTLLSAPYDGDVGMVPDPLADRGDNVIEYSFFVHSNDITDCEMQKMAMEYERESVLLSGGKAELAGKDLLEIPPEEMITTSVKKTDGGYAVRGFDTDGNIKELVVKSK